MAKRYEELTFSDDFMFCKVLQNNPEVCKELTELILEKKIGNFVAPETQKAITITADGHGVRFDVYFEDDWNTIFNIEMQQWGIDNLPKRTRYYQGMIDLNQLEKGATYDKLRTVTSYSFPSKTLMRRSVSTNTVSEIPAQRNPDLRWATPQ